MEYDFRIAQNAFSGIDIKLKANPYFMDIISQLEKIDLEQTDRPVVDNILYVSSPIREHAQSEYGDENYWGFTEESAFRYFMENIAVLNHPTRRVILRPHPSEAKDKYDWAVEEFSPNVSIGGKTILLNEVAQSDIIVGYNSMAMVIGLIAGKRVINALPAGKMENSLPMVEIESMADLLQKWPV